MEFEAIDYFSLNDNYTERTITDAQTVVTSITIDGKSKAVHYLHRPYLKLVLTLAQVL